MTIKLELFDSLLTTTVLLEIAFILPQIKITDPQSGENQETVFVTIEAPTALDFYKFGLLMAEKYYSQIPPAPEPEKDTIS